MSLNLLGTNEYNYAFNLLLKEQMRHNSDAKSTLYLGKRCDDLLYYYHSDHIGSSTFLTDALGIPYETPTTKCWTQRNMIKGVPSVHNKMHSESAKLNRTDEFMLYLPFGEAMAQQKVAGWATPYTFTGKEQDAATGLHYFGARYLDTRLSMWFGVDPLAEKYPDHSPFNYVLNNPIRLIDPTGMAAEEFPPTDLDASITSYCDSDGCFNRNTSGEVWSWTDNDENNMGYVISELEVVANRDDVWERIADGLGNGIINVLDIDENKLGTPEHGTKEILKLGGKIGSIGINILSLGEGAAAMKGASTLGKVIAGYGMANDANGLVVNITGTNLIESAIGEKAAAINSTINATVGLGSSMYVKKGGIGNVGDVKDLIIETPKIFSGQKPKNQ